MSEYAIRTATVDDAEAVSALLAASYPELMKEAYPAAVLTPALARMTKANPRLLESGRFYVAGSAKGSLVGCGGWSTERPGGDLIEHGLAHIRHFATHPAWTGKGIGRALYEWCESDAAAIGCTALECWASLNAEGFYEALGFERVAEINVRIGPSVLLPSIRMRRRISRAAGP